MMVANPQQRPGPTEPADSRLGAGSHPVTLPRSEQFALRSRVGRAYRIFVAWPASPPPAEGFGVIYLLDANATFGTMVEAMRMQSRHPGATGVAPALIVGIGYPTEEPFDVERRTYDLTPAAKGGQPGALATGGAAEMLDFIADEVMPVIERRFTTDGARRALVGHSFGGLFVLHALFNRPALFSAYLAASPSIWWQERAILDHERRFYVRGQMTDRVPKVAIMVGELEQVAEPAFPEAGSRRAADLAARRMVDNARDMAGRLAAFGLRVQFSVLAGETHPSSLPIAINRALRLLSEPVPGGVEASEAT
ncbi:alpha/beta hydrolase [Bosea sp. 685]|uniref:alpha/beta hydrolase n=1 Tax=Bosea sp. 685 TaxID=3080057 RepID=UPI0028932BFE|nr:alpha/beta hydrolase-fold protein [Bosea sp. 685]WNJ93120.1 alpha/beta hydrolase-fold protein [Bosea sp. 685]